MAKPEPTACAKIGSDEGRRLKERLDMINKVFSRLFGCRHKRVTRPISPAHRPGTKASSGAAYVACLECGKQFHYDLQNMQMGEPIHAAAMPASAVPFQSQY